MEEIQLFGLKVHNVTIDETLDEINRLVKEGGAHLVVTLGVEMVVRAEQDSEFFDIVNRASLVVPDSVGILWAAKQVGYKLKERVPGIDILLASAARSEKYPWKVFLLGSEPGVAEKAAEKLKAEFPGFNIVGTHHGYFRDHEEEVLQKITDAGPDILFVAMGFPFQEKWFMKHRERLGNIVALGVGGSLDVIAGTVRRAPILMRKMGLEWLYRLVSQPSRIQRQLALPKFTLRVLLKGVSKQ